MLAGILALTLLALVAAGSGAGGRTHPPGAYRADTTLRPEDVVRAYVGAINRRDGARFCAVVASWISGRLDLAGNDPDAPLLRPRDCPELVHALIGYVEDCCPPKFLRAEIVEIRPARTDGALRRVDVELRLHVDDQGTPKTMPLEDVVWLVRDRGAWRVAKLGAVAAAASLAGATPGGPLARPNVSQERRRFAADVAAFARRQRAREASFRRTTPKVDCTPTVTVRDAPGGVRDWILPAPSTPLPRVGRADLASVSLAGDARSLCIRFETVGAVRGPSTFGFAMHDRRAQGSFAQSFEVALRADGKARVTSGIDAQRHPIAVPAKVGVSKNRLALVLDRRSFSAGKPGAHSTGAPSLRAFAFGASVKVRLGVRRETYDPLGSEPNDTSFSFPGGRPCSSPC